MAKRVVDTDPSDAASDRDLVERLKRCVETISRGFGRWGDPHTKGPGLYFVVVSESATGFAEPMGRNRWPVEDCGSVFADFDVLVETARAVASTCDGAVIVHTDGTIEGQMVRLTQLPAVAGGGRADDLPYTGWMGARHMSALETSTRQEVVATITLSEEDGRVTVFTDGTVEDHHRSTRQEERRGPD